MLGNLWRILRENEITIFIVTTKKKTKDITYSTEISFIIHKPHVTI